MKREALLDAIDPYKRTKMMVEIEDYGQERILPSLKQNRPNAGYSNLSVRNMYIVNPTQKGQSRVYLYNKTVGGKGANEVCSIRLHNITENWNMRKMNRIPHPSINP